MRHFAVTQRQWDQIWMELPPQFRLLADDTEPRSKAGYVCMKVNDLLIWTDQYIPEDQWDYELAGRLQEFSTRFKRTMDNLHWESKLKLQEARQAAEKVKLG